MALTSFRDLRVWQAGMDLVEQVYRLTQTLPKQEAYGLSAQMQRAAVSIPANIAEGYSRRYRAEYTQFVSISHASLAELETHIETAKRVDYVSVQQYTELLRQTDALSKQLRALQKARCQDPLPNPDPRR
jgi:four helix bundle protein